MSEDKKYKFEYLNIAILGLSTIQVNSKKMFNLHMWKWMVVYFFIIYYICNAICDMEVHEQIILQKATPGVRSQESATRQDPIDMPTSRTTVRVIRCGKQMYYLLETMQARSSETKIWQCVLSCTTHIDLTVKIKYYSILKISVHL